ncbi:UDP-glucosyltransferase 2-like isoform X2 [Eriocheir sinensis]|uniref:UDP-glucosyltransferase 2-like isoform X2 n=1 Tax=Eriocheir sinensis TaxID=95602 RepID=UPI0021C817D2|nr:UDP-glucosyltransferase 2-like isoform X2 [Eriocheir sinensis]
MQAFRWWWWALAVVVVAPLAGPAEASNILVLTPFGSRSVRSLFRTLTEALSARGHQVTLVTSGEPPPPHPNITHLRAPHSALDQMDLFEVRRDSAAFRLWLKALPAVARRLYEDSAIMDLWHRRKEFDAIIINSAANEMAFPFLIGVEAPFITLAPVGTEPLQLAYLGNMVSPAALPSVVVPYDDTLTLWERLVNTLATALLRTYFRRSVGRPLAAALRETFPDLPDPYEEYPRQALALLNRHHLLDGAVPLLPNQVEVGCMNCRPADPLPQAHGTDGEVLGCVKEKCSTKFLTSGCCSRHRLTEQMGRCWAASRRSVRQSSSPAAVAHVTGSRNRRGGVGLRQGEVFDKFLTSGCCSRHRLTEQKGRRWAASGRSVRQSSSPAAVAHVTGSRNRWGGVGLRQGVAWRWEAEYKSRVGKITVYQGL